MNSAEEKRRLRAAYAEKRASLKTPEKDEAIARNFLSCFAKERNFFVYCAFRTEAATESIIRALLAQDKRVCVPRIVGREMRAVPLAGELVKNEYGIYEPAGGEDTFVEVAAVPLLAVDKEGYRLGYGGGYYDRYFEKHGNVLRVGLMFAGQAVETLPREKTDIPLHAVITEDGARFFTE